MICRIGKFQCAEANVIECLIVNTKGLVCVLYELVNGEGCIVGLSNCIGHFRRWNNTVAVHDSVGELLTNLGDEQCTHSSPSATTKGVCELEALETVAALSLLAYHINNRVGKFSTFRIMSLGPVVTGTTLPCRCKMNVLIRRCVDSWCIQKIVFVYSWNTTHE